MKTGTNGDLTGASLQGGNSGSNGTNRGRTTIQQLAVLGAGSRLEVSSATPPRSLPAPPFPRHPAKCGDVEPDPRLLPQNGNPYRTSVTVAMIRRALRGWLYPYVGSRLKPGDFHPIISYLFTEWKCNLDCHYCWAYDNHVQGMTEDTADAR